MTKVRFVACESTARSMRELFSPNRRLNFYFFHFSFFIFHLSSKSSSHRTIGGWNPDVQRAEPWEDARRHPPIILPFSFFILQHRHTSNFWGTVQVFMGGWREDDRLHPPMLNRPVYRHSSPLWYDGRMILIFIWKLKYLVVWGFLCTFVNWFESEFCYLK